ncbi:membrane-spanning 4-domains subfamily A member 15-like [Misgurnus anguillicaudatus]|uniref:membrane-spanning 4-domains subfamily A member 15-like n=1 Tax=Misgurnus anguillicaudatus TaxID=75329 RepID=UPI003CCFC526
MSSQVISTDNGKVVIQINPLINQESAEGKDKRGTYAPLQWFLKVQPKSLGTVQIMIGVVTLMIGIVVTIKIDHFMLTAISGINLRGSFTYIIAGSLSVVAENKLNSCVVKASLGMNVISAITAGVAIILLSIKLQFMAEWRYNSIKNVNVRIYSAFQVLGCGIIVVLLLLSVLQFILSICISGFACKATCGWSSVVNVSINQSVSEKETTPLNMPQQPRRN